jgi:hypothetical protein
MARGSQLPSLDRSQGGEARHHFGDFGGSCGGEQANRSEGGRLSRLGAPPSRRRCGARAEVAERQRSVTCPGERTTALAGAVVRQAHHERMRGSPRADEGAHHERARELQHENAALPARFCLFPPGPIWRRAYGAGRILSGALCRGDRATREGAPDPASGGWIPVFAAARQVHRLVGRPVHGASVATPAGAGRRSDHRL